MSPALKLAAEFIGIVERSIVDKCNFPRAIEMGVSIFVRFASVGGPTCVCNANVMPFGSNRALSDKFETVCILSHRCILCDRLGKLFCHDF